MVFFVASIFQWLDLSDTTYMYTSRKVKSFEVRNDLRAIIYLGTENNNI